MSTATMTVGELIAYLQGLNSPGAPVFLYSMKHADRIPLNPEHLDDSLVGESENYLDINIADDDFHFAARNKEQAA